MYHNLACKNKMTVGSNESGIKQRKFKLIQVPSLLFRPSELDSIILEEISNEKEPTCFVDGLRSDIKGFFKFSYYFSYTVIQNPVVGGNGKPGFDYQPARRFSINSQELKLNRRRPSTIKRVVSRLKICQSF